MTFNLTDTCLYNKFDTNKSLQTVTLVTVIFFPNCSLSNIRISKHKTGQNKSNNCVTEATSIAYSSKCY